MIILENHCVDCAVPGYPCLGIHCPKANVEVHRCDECNTELDDIYEVDGEELCEECLKDRFRRTE